MNPSLLRSFYRRLPALFWCCLFLMLAPPVLAANAFDNTDGFPFATGVFSSGDSGKEWQALDNRLEQIDSDLKESARGGEKQLQLKQQEVEAIKESVSAYIKMLEQQVSQLDSELNTLGKPGEEEPSSVTEQRKSVQEQKGKLEGKLVGYRLLLLHSETLDKKLMEMRQQLITDELLARGSTTPALLQKHGELTWRWVGGSLSYLFKDSGLQLLGSVQLLGYAALIVLAVITGSALRRRCLGWCREYHDENYHYALVLLASLSTYAPHLLAGVMTAILVQLLFSSSPQLFIYNFGITLPLLFASWAVLHFLFRGHGVGGAAFSLPNRISKGFGRSLKFAILVGYVGYLVFNTGAIAAASEPGKLLARDIFVVMLVLSLMWTNHYLRLLMSEHGVRGLGGVLFLLLLGSLVAEVTGYRNIAYWVLRAVIGSSLIIFFSWLLSHLMKEFFDSLRVGKLWWQQGVRRLFGYGMDESMPWLGWVYLLAATAVWMIAAYFVMLVWGVPNTTITQLYNYLLEGFQIGSLTIIPLRIVVAIIVFAVLLAISSWVRGRMEDKWLVKSRMERGSREALVTISGYVGVALAILVALGVAGVQFTNLAIIAGALSVGIGFGLQNIVNNFVSGLILLFERPVKTGDWIIVGNTEGYVKRISIRSTLIQTFDRADVIVPNSELISGQVTNWMLYDPRGRIRVPVGVAYGSDTEKVRDILLKIAGDHPSIITDGSATEPKVLFLNFGESSLDFELRAFISNIDERLQVVSDINFAIDAAFRSEGVEIPFPQRDLHVRSWQDPPKE